MKINDFLGWPRIFKTDYEKRIEAEKRSRRNKIILGVGAGAIALGLYNKRKV